MTIITVEDIRKISDNNLQELFDRCSREIAIRRQKKCDALIEDFLEAWQALQDIGMNVIYFDDTMEDSIRLDQYDGFHFT